MKVYKTTLSIATVLMLCHNIAYAQPKIFSRKDHLFLARGKSMVTVATGIPYLGITEYAYGFSDRFSVGVLIGQTPKIAGYGIRVRRLLYQSDDRFRLYFRAPILYYPRTKGLGGDPWFLTRPVLSGEWKTDSGVRFSLGGGFVAAACANSLLGLENHEQNHDHREHDHKTEEEIMDGFWNTVHAGFAFPISNRVMFQSELSAVLSGLKIAGADWVGGPPVILVLGFSYTW